MLDNRATKVVGALLVGVGVANLARYTRQVPGRRTSRTLITYLREHLAGSDAAVHIVDRLRHSHHGSLEGILFTSLYEEIQADREVLRQLLSRLGASPASLKRVAARSAGVLLRVAGDGEPGDLSLFRTLEGLSIGIQGKRCLWRGLQSLEPALKAPGSRSFAELESSAIQQWEAIERHRLGLIPETFPVQKPTL